MSAYGDVKRALCFVRCVLVVAALISIVAMAAVTTATTTTVVVVTPRTNYLCRYSSVTSSPLSFFLAQATALERGMTAAVDLNLLLFAVSVPSN